MICIFKIEKYNSVLFYSIKNIKTRDVQFNLLSCDIISINSKSLSPVIVTNEIEKCFFKYSIKSSECLFCVSDQYKYLLNFYRTYVLKHPISSGLLYFFIKNVVKNERLFFNSYFIFLDFDEFQKEMAILLIKK